MAAVLVTPLRRHPACQTFIIATLALAAWVAVGAVFLAGWWLIGEYVAWRWGG